MKRLIIPLTILAMLSCTDRKIVSGQELKDYVLDPGNGLLKRASGNGVDIEVIYRPTDLVLAQQLDGMTDESERRKEIENFEGLSYFIVKLSRQGQEVENAYAGDPGQFTNVVNYLSSGISANMYLVNDRDTIASIDAVYTRMFGAAKATSVMAIFDTNLTERSGTLTFCFDDTQLGLGRSEFTFDLTDIKNTPTLNLK